MSIQPENSCHTALLSFGCSIPPLQEDSLVQAKLYVYAGHCECVAAVACGWPYSPEFLKPTLTSSLF